MGATKDSYEQVEGSPALEVPEVPKPTITVEFRRAFPKQAEAMLEDWRKMEEWRKKFNSMLLQNQSA